MNEHDFCLIKLHYQSYELVRHFFRFLVEDFLHETKRQDDVDIDDTCF